MIYSTFVFNNELGLLDLKLEEELPVFDKIIIAESDRTFSNKKKEVLLVDNKKYLDPKIEIRFVNGSQFTDNFWNNEAIQRDATAPDANDKDIIFHGDVDWIVHRDDVEKIAETVRQIYIGKIKTQLHYYYLNVRDGYINNLFAIRYDCLKKYFGNSLFKVCKTNIVDARIVDVRSMHFGYLGEPETIKNKIMAFSHDEFQHSEFLDPKNIQKRKRQLKDPFDRDVILSKVEIDENFPISIQQNIDNLRDWIL